MPTTTGSAHTDGGSTRIPHTPQLGDIYAIDGTAYEVATFDDGDTKVIFESVAPPTAEVIMPVGAVRTTDAATYVE